MLCPATSRGRFAPRTPHTAARVRRHPARRVGIGRRAPGCSCAGQSRFSSTGGRSRRNRPARRRFARARAHARRRRVLGQRRELEALAFATETRVPVFANDLGRGVVPADHELAFSRARKLAFDGADLVVVAGTPLDFRLGFGVVQGTGRAPVRLGRDGSPRTRRSRRRAQAISVQRSRCSPSPHRAGTGDTTAPRARHGSRRCARKRSTARRRRRSTHVRRHADRSGAHLRRASPAPRATRS